MKLLLPRVPDTLNPASQVKPCKLDEPYTPLNLLLVPLADLPTFPKTLRPGEGILGGFWGARAAGSRNSGASGPVGFFWRGLSGHLFAGVLDGQKFGKMLPKLSKSKRKIDILDILVGPGSPSLRIAVHELLVSTKLPGSQICTGTRSIGAWTGT